jgi:hypothetical protein
MNNDYIKPIVGENGICLSYLLLGCSIFICSGFAYWLYIESDIEKIRNYRFESNRLIDHDQLDEYKKFHTETLESIFDDEIDQIWWYVIREAENGFVKLQLYSRLLAGNPDREDIYKEIAALLDIAPEEFSNEDRTKYLNSLKEIKGIRNVLLEKYSLLASTTQK